MRFTKIPLIATLMAVALSLLIVLPTLAQISGDLTDGRQATGKWIDVRVADKLTDDIAGATDTTISAGSGAFAVAGTPYDAKDTYFKGNLYISNDEKAFNTILVTAAVAEADLAKTNDGSASPPVTDAPCPENTLAAKATIRNMRSGVSVTAYLRDSGSDEGSKNIFHGIVAVWDQEEAVDPHSGLCDTTPFSTSDNSPNHGDPQQYAGSQEETDDKAADPVRTGPEDGWTRASAAVIPARDGDVISVSVQGVSGSIELIVDGDAPVIEDITPSHGGMTNKPTVALGFTVSDDGAGLRYDGESGDSGDDDRTPHNGDGDQRFDEPLTSDPEGPDGTAGNADDVAEGTTEDIKVYFTDTVDSAYNPAKLDADGNLVAAPDGTTLGVGYIQIGANIYVAVDSTKAGKAAPDAGEVGFVDGRSPNWDAATESSQYGTNGWTQRTKGVEYDLDMTQTGQAFGTHYWQITATDRVGNMVTTDSDEDEAGAQAYSFKVDNAKPKVVSARTGIGYKAGAGNGEFKDRSWIALNFVNDNTTGGADRIDAGSVDPTDFTVEGHSVSSVLVPSDSKKCKAGDDDNIDSLDDGCDFEPRARVYLKLTGELASDETPTIQILGGVLKDIAGNNNVTQSIEDVQDKIAPGVSISVTGGASDRAAADKDGAFTVRVSSDEDLKRFPTLHFATIVGTDTNGVATGTTIGAVGDVVSLSEKETNTWEVKVNADDSGKLPGSGDRILAVIVVAEDVESNAGHSKGWTGNAATGPVAGNKLKFKDLDSGGFLVEIDNSMEAADIQVLPPSDPSAATKDKTESTNPYIQINFKEHNEYGINVGGDKQVYKADIGDGKSSGTDSHPDVTITALTLNGEDRLPEVVRVSAGKYVLAVTGLEVGEYEIVYSAHDDVGNDDVGESGDVTVTSFTFEVQERQPYKVALQPGWNLISVPGDPFNPAVGEVVGSSLKADTVLGYQGGEWVTAVRNEDGRWQGTLTDIRGGYGYWVRTTALESISTVIPPILPTANLPSVPVTSGWNLLGVVDAQQRKAGTTEDADQYFTSLNVWRVAYGFNTQLNRWSKLLPGTDDEVANGKGYWVWSTKAGTLVP